MKHNSTFGKRLKYIIRQSGFYRQSDFANAVAKRGVSIQHSMVSRMINGSVQPSIDMMEAIADETGVSMDWLMGRSDEATTSAISQRARMVAGLIDGLPAGLQDQAVQETKAICDQLTRKYKSNQEAYVHLFDLIEKHGGAELRRMVELDTGIAAPSPVDKLNTHIGNIQDTRNGLSGSANFVEQGVLLGE